MILVNGQEQDRIAVTDRGLQYGDGLFETIAIHAGEPRLWDRHWQRLITGCRQLGIEAIEQRPLLNEVRQVCTGVEKGVLKLIITRGEGGRGYRPAPAMKSTRIVATYPWPDYPEVHWRRGVTVRVCATRLGCNPALAGLKHLNRLEQVIARREWNNSDIAEGLMLDTDDRVIAGTMSNLFIVNAERLLTPALTSCGVKGIMRGLILDLADERGIPREEASLSLHDLRQASEVFLCNALIGIWPVRCIEQQDYAVGPITTLLSKHIDESLSSI